MNSMIHGRTIWLTALCAGLALAPSITRAAGTIFIEMRETSQTDEAIVRLGDVAQITADRNTSFILSRLDLDEFSEQGVVQVSQNLARVRVKLAGIPNVRWAGSSQCVVKRVKVQPFAIRLFAELQRQYAEALNVEPDEVKIKQLQTVKPPDADRLSRFTIALPATTRRLGAQRVTVEAISRRGKKQRLSILHEVSVKRAFPVLERAIGRGELIGSSDYRWVKRFTTDVQGTLTDDDIEGKTLGSGAAAGAELQAAMLLDPSKVKIVMPRQQVVCVAKVGGITVTMPDGVALTAGARGESIRIRNPTSNQEFIAVVLNAKKVQVLR